jgi:hypothetical protein
MDRHNPACKAASLLFTSLTLWSAAAAAAPGDPLGPPFSVNLYQSDAERPGGVIASPAGFKVFWSSSNGNTGLRYFTRFDTNGARLSGDLARTTDYGDVASAPDGRYVTTYSAYIGNHYAVLAQRYDANDIPVGPALEVTDPAAVLGPSSTGTSRVAMNASGDFIVSWVQVKLVKVLGNGCGGGFGLPRNCLNTYQTTVFARRYAADGTPSAAVTVNSGQEINAYVLDLGGDFGSQLREAAVALAHDGSFAVTWVSATEATTYLRNAQVKLRYFPAVGNAQLARTVEASSASGVPEVVMDGASNIVVAYRKHAFGNIDDVSLWLRRYAAATGNALGAAQRIDTGMSLGQGDLLKLAATGGGAFAVGWAHADAGIHLQRYAADGSAVGGKLTVSGTGVYFWSLHMAAGNGRLMLAWGQSPDPFTEQDVWARVYETP